MYHVLAVSLSTPLYTQMTSISSVSKQFFPPVWIVVTQAQVDAPQRTKLDQKQDSGTSTR